MAIQLMKGYGVPKEGSGQYNGLGRMAFAAFYGESEDDANLLLEPSAAPQHAPQFMPSVELGDEPYTRWGPFYGYDGVQTSAPMQFGVRRMTGGDVRGYGCDSSSGMGCGYKGYGEEDECPSRSTWLLLGIVLGGMLWPKLAAYYK